MGELARIHGMRIKMYSFDTQRHNEPHFHVFLPGGQSASVSIATGRILEGCLVRKQKSQILSWLFIHKEEMWDRWNQAVSGNLIEKIAD